MIAMPAEGRELALVGRVIHGDGRGRQLGFPTANLQLSDGSQALAGLDWGVYAAQVHWQGRQRLQAVANWGRRPTFESAGEAILELHIIDFCEDIYGRELRVELSEFLRPEKAFASAEQLKEQIAEDIRRTQQHLSEIREE